MIPPFPPEEDWQLTVGQQFSIENMVRQIPQMSPEQVQETMRGLLSGYLRQQNLTRELSKTICNISFSSSAGSYGQKQAAPRTTEG